MDRREKEVRPGSGAGLGPVPEPGDVAGGTGMVERERSGSRTQRVGMIALARGDVLGRAIRELSRTIEGAVVEPPEPDGTFEVRVDAPSFEAALQRVWDGVAAAGVDDQVAFAEHAELPEHWRHRASARP